MKHNQLIKDLCTGCGLCHSIYGCEFHIDGDGFANPKLNNAIVCPMQSYKTSEQFLIWGTYLNTYEGYAKDKQIRHKASSGGALTAIAIYLLESGYVNGIIHTKAKAGYPLETETVVSHTRDDVLKCMGSRYTASAPLMDILSLIEAGKKYAFIGKPCDIIALNNYIEFDSKLKAQIVFTMSFFCAGMPSIKANVKLLSAMGCDPKQLSEFQYRGNGWPGYAIAIDNSGIEYRSDYQTAWGNYLGRDVRKICRLCMDGIGEKADIVCADLWHLNKENRPDFSEHEGRNIVFCRTDLSEKVFAEVVNNGLFCAERFTDKMDEFKYYQPYQFERRTTMKYKLLPMRIFRHNVPNYNKKLLNDACQYATFESNWKIFRGTVKRIFQGKL